MSNVTVSMFPDCNKMKNRRFTPAELEQEKIVAAAFKRPMCYFTQDRPFYPYVSPNPFKPTQMVNFDLNFVE